MTGVSNMQRELINRLSRIEGQVRGISRMVDEDKNCIDILTQVSAASRALQCAALLLLEDHCSTAWWTRHRWAGRSARTGSRRPRRRSAGLSAASEPSAPRSGHSARHRRPAHQC